MIDLIKKAALTGIGVASLATDKIEEYSKELITKGKMSEQEGEKFVQEMMVRAEESREALKKQTESIVQKALGSVDLVKASDVEALRTEIAKLRLELEALRGGQGKEKEQE